MYAIINVEGILQRLDLSLCSVEELTKLQEEYHFDVIQYSTDPLKGVE